MARGPHIAEGGQGRLYLVVDSAGEFSDQYILKELKNPKRLDRFNVELKAITSLGVHPNVVPLIDAGIYSDPDKPWFVMPKADGTLADLTISNALNIDDRMSVFDNVCEGVAYLHTKSIIHRDLKPENILMFAGVPKVSDFGLCLIAGTPRLTPSSEVVGSRFYMAPEMEDGRQADVGFGADVYSLGKVLYYVLSGGKVFSREKYRNRGLRISTLAGDTRQGLFEPVFEKSITVETRRRYRDAGELQAGFRKALSKFRKDPLTTLLKRFQSIDNALQASESELRSLSRAEWAELLSRAKEIRTGISQHLLMTACDLVDSKFARSLAEVLLNNESRLDSQFLAFAAGRILCLPQGSGLSHSWLQPELFSRLAIHALDHPDNALLNAIAKGSMFTLRNCEEVLSKLAENLSVLQPEARRNFLIASMKSPYRQKERLLLSLSRDGSLDNVSIEAVVAGLCACATPATISRVIELADRKDMNETLAAIGRGMVQGSSPDIAIQLGQHDWSSPVMKVLIDVMQKPGKYRAGNSNRMESDEE